MSDAPTAACISTFRIPDNADLLAIREALATAPRCVLIVRSAFTPASPRNPLRWEERVQILREALGEDAQRVQCVPLRDWYDDEREQQDIARILADAGLPAGTQPRAVDESPQAAARRLALCDAADPASALQAFEHEAPQATLTFLRRWISTPAFAHVQDERRQLEHERKAWSVAPYPVVLSTVDAVIEVAGHVLLIRRGRQPGKGLWAIPGGFLDPKEPVYDAAVRELVEETRFDLSAEELRAALRAVRVFSHPQRSQRGRVITHAHHFDLGMRALPPVQGADDAAAAHWVPIDRLASMEAEFLDDHFLILDSFLGLLPH